MRRLITLPARRLWTLLAAVCVLALGAGIAQAALRSGGDKPPAKPLDRAIRAAVTAPDAPGISARIEFVNHLLPSGSLGGQSAGSPLLQGAKGRLWLTGDGRMRLELQSDSGDAQIVSDGAQASLYDATSNTVYRADLPQGRHEKESVPTLAQIDRGLAHLGRAWTLSRAIPGTIAGQPSYTLRIAPKDDGGLLGAAEVAWDAAHGTPLRAAIYAQGQSAPVVELKATSIRYGSIPASDVTLKPPAGAKVVQVDAPSKGSAKGHRHGASVTGAKAVAGKLSFPLSAPAKLAGLPRRDVRLVSMENDKGALVTYGRGLGAIVVFEHAAQPQTQSKGRGAEDQLPSVNVNGATGKELATALGTVVTFERAGVAYTVAGSVPPVAAENAARGLK
jgi:outer membrane lipoprotein-sorting protein